MKKNCLHALIATRKISGMCQIESLMLIVSHIHPTGLFQGNLIFGFNYINVYFYSYRIALKNICYF